MKWFLFRGHVNFRGGNFSFLLNIMGCADRDEQMSVWDDKFSILNDEQLVWGLSTCHVQGVPLLVKWSSHKWPYKLGNWGKHPTHRGL